VSVQASEWRARVRSCLVLEKAEKGWWLRLLKVEGKVSSSQITPRLEEVGVAVERLIVKDLIEETVWEPSACFGQNPLASRRQLFA
jgi:hypothetical protein